MVIDKGHISGCDDTAGKPSAMQRVDWRDRRCYRWTLAVYIPLRRRFINIHMQNSAMFIALADDIIPDFDVPAWIWFTEINAPL